MDRRESLKLLGSLPLMAFGATRASASEHKGTKATAQKASSL